MEGIFEEVNFVSYGIALEMKLLGFNEPCFARFINKEFRYGTLGGVSNFTKDYLNQISAPLYQQAFAWFRKNYGLDYEMRYAGRKDEYYPFVRGYNYDEDSSLPLTYEEGEAQCIFNMIEIVKRKIV